jgi:hypothetical protein
VIKNSLNNLQIAELENFLESIQSMLNRGSWTKEELVTLFEKTLVGFEHEEKGKFLDNKM